MAHRFSLSVVAMVAWLSFGALFPPGKPAFAQGLITKPYLMSFDTCAPCTGPKSSFIQLAQSDDGVSWELVPGYTPINGGVPAVARRGNTIYILSDAPNGGQSAIQVQRFRIDAGVWEDPVNITLDDPYALGPTIDPDVIVNAQGQLVLIYYTNFIGCPSSVCHLREAIEVPGSDGTEFVALQNDIYSSTVSDFVDATSFYDGSQYVVYMPVHDQVFNPSMTAGPQGIGVYTSRTLSGPFAVATAFPNGTLLSPAPNFLAGWGTGFYNAARGQYWTYVNYQSVPGPPVLPGPIYRAVKSIFGQQISIGDLTPVMTDAGLGLDPGLVTFHMHFAKNWSGSETTTASVLPHSASIGVGDTVTATVALTNTDVASAADCFVAPLTSLPAAFSYRAIDATGAPIAPVNSPVSVRGNGGVLNFTISITLTAPIVTTDVQFNIGCASTTNAVPVSGVNTLLLVTDYTSNDTPNYQGLWWASPAGSEAGWGINFAHQGDVIFATWFTYDTTGKAWWLAMQANRTAPGVYAGTIFTTHGPPFNAVPFNPALVTETPLGSGTLSFSDGNDASFAYTVNGVTQTKALVREVFAAPVPVCVFGGMSNLAQATDYQDLWWASPGGVESGWGVNLTQQGEVIFATWFTYDGNGDPLWLSGPALKTSAGEYTGTLSRTTGPAFNAVPFDPSKVTETPVGTLTLSFSDGANGTFAYTVNGVSQVKAITREVFVAPGTVCQ